MRPNQHRGQLNHCSPHETGGNPSINYEPSMLGGLEEAEEKALEQQYNDMVPGREAGEKSRYGLGTKKQQDAVKDAEDKGRDAEPY